MKLSSNVQFGAVNINDLEEGKTYRFNKNYHNKDLQGTTTTLRQAIELPNGSLLTQWSDDATDYWHSQTFIPIERERDGKPVSLEYLDEIEEKPSKLDTNA